jgi:acetyl esterase/lipase
MRLSVLWLLIPGAAVYAQVDPADLLRAAIPAADHRLAYGSDPLEFGELRLPKTKGPFPVAVLIHGGCWVDRLPGADPRLTTLELLRPLAAALAQAGVATWNVEYRRAGSPGGGGWPGSYLDLGSAVDYLRKIAPAYSLDPDRVVVAGHSSGGQLALWIAARPRLPASSHLYAKNPLQVKAAIDIDGPPDLASYQPRERWFCGIAGITQFMGGTPGERPERYREGSALSFLPLGVPQEIISAALLQGAQELVGAYEVTAKAKGDRVTLLTLEKSSHFDMLAPEGMQGKALIQAILSLAGMDRGR